MTQAGGRALWQVADMADVGGRLATRRRALRGAGGGERVTENEKARADGCPRGPGGDTIWFRKSVV